MAGIKGGGVNKIAVVWSSVQFTVVSCGLGERVLLSFFFLGLLACVMLWSAEIIGCCMMAKYQGRYS